MMPARRNVLMLIDCDGKTNKWQSILFADDDDARCAGMDSMRNVTIYSLYSYSNPRGYCIAFYERHAITST